MYNRYADTIISLQIKQKKKEHKFYKLKKRKYKLLSFALKSELRRL